MTGFVFNVNAAAFVPSTAITMRTSSGPSSSFNNKRTKRRNRKTSRFSKDHHDQGFCSSQISSSRSSPVSDIITKNSCTVVYDYRAPALKNRVRSYLARFRPVVLRHAQFIVTENERAEAVFRELLGYTSPNQHMFDTVATMPCEQERFDQMQSISPDSGHFSPSSNIHPELLNAHIHQFIARHYC